VITNHIINQTIMKNFALGLGDNKIYPIERFFDFDHPVASYGYLRGVGDLYKKCKEFWYLDHGYFKQSSRKFQGNKVLINQFDGYFRIVHNNFFHDASVNFSCDRFEKLNLDIKPQKKDGDYIILSEPTDDVKSFYNLENWTDNTIKLIKKYSDRKIIIHSRDSNILLTELLPQAFAFVSDHSSAGFLAMLQGVPAYFTNSTLSNIGKIQDIENYTINEKIFFNLAYCQWTLKEIQSGEAWQFISKELY